MGVILDAGPLLNFLAVGQQNVLIQLAQSQGLDLSVPEVVDREVQNLCVRDRRFASSPAPATWRKLIDTKRILILSDELTDDALLTAISRVSGVAAETRRRDPASLGEILVIAHGSVLAQQGSNVYLLIDDGDGRRRAKQEIAFLKQKGTAGRMYLWSTRQILEQVDPAWFHQGKKAKEVYNRMRAFDDGLPPVG